MGDKEDMTEIDLKDTETVAEIMLENLVIDYVTMGKSHITGVFSGCMERQYESLYEEISVYGKAMWNREGEQEERLRESILCMVDGLMSLCIQKGFETGCRVGGFSLDDFITSDSGQKAPK